MGFGHIGEVDCAIGVLIVGNISFLGKVSLTLDLDGTHQPINASLIRFSGASVYIVTGAIPILGRKPATFVPSDIVFLYRRITDETSQPLAA
jgi:hypothetical protein